MVMVYLSSSMCPLALVYLVCMIVAVPECEKLNALEVAALAGAHAAHAAESAFFDETLLELLYFPDNQKHVPFYATLFLFRIGSNEVRTLLLL